MTLNDTTLYMDIAIGNIIKLLNDDLITSYQEEKLVRLVFEHDPGILILSKHYGSNLKSFHKYAIVLAPDCISHAITPVPQSVGPSSSVAITISSPKCLPKKTPATQFLSQILLLLSNRFLSPLNLRPQLSSLCPLQSAYHS